MTPVSGFKVLIEKRPFSKMNMKSEKRLLMPFGPFVNPTFIVD